VITLLNTDPYPDEDYYTYVRNRIYKKTQCDVLLEICDPADMDSFSYLSASIIPKACYFCKHLFTATQAYTSTYQIRFMLKKPDEQSYENSKVIYVGAICKSREACNYKESIGDCN